MQTTKVMCDECGRDLSTTGNCEDYRVLVAAQAIPRWGGGTSTDMAIEPEPDRPAHFCSWEHLKAYIVAGKYPSRPER